MTFKTTWAEAEYYLDQGISVIPVRDKPQTYNGREYPVKSAYPWAKYNKEIISKGELMYLMTEKYDTQGFGIVAGAVSGNLEIIDIDVKNWEGIDTRLFQDIKSLFPHLWSKLRIHRSPSCGYHILYRISDHLPEGNRKLAFKTDRKEAAIETRGTGGYVVASSAMGYSVINDNPIPVITWAERCSIIAICEGYNERIKTIALPISKAQSDYYDENPWSHYNSSHAAESILVDYGWSICGSSNNFVWFTRPGKTSGVSASFNREKRVFYIFTSSTELEPSKGYNPSTLLSILKFNNDKKKTYNWLVDNGYGKVKSHIEKQKIQRISRNNLLIIPPNFSNESKAAAEKLRQNINELHPHGFFWRDNDKGGYSISREMIVNIADKLGFKYHVGNVVKIHHMLIFKIDDRDFQDELKSYIKEPDAEIYEQISNAYEAFIQKSGKYTMTRLPKLNTELILSDTKDISYKFFQNGFLSITTDLISFHEYDSISDVLIWAEKCQPRNYNKGAGGKYNDFLSLAITSSTIEHVMRCIGFLCHEYKDETTGYIIVLTEECQDPINGGGSGKNVFCNLLSYATTYTSKPGSQAKFDEKFFQSWNGQRIFCISDVSKNFDFTFLKEPSTGSFIWKRLFKDEVEIKNSDAPKFIVQTNFSYEISDGGLRRRIIPIEFNDFFTRCGGLDIHFGCHFPSGWSSSDWAGFDNFIAESIQKWMQYNRKLSAPTLTIGGWRKQFIQTYGHIISDVIAQNWEDWIKQHIVPNEQFKATLMAYYNENDIPKQYHPSTQRINAALREYGAKHGYSIETDALRRIDVIVQKCRIFIDNEVPF